MIFVAGAIILLLAMCGFSAIPFAYLFSYKKTVSGGFASFMTISMLVGVVGTVAVVVMELSGDDYYVKLGSKIKYFGLLVPQFGLTYSGVKFARKAVWNNNWDLKDAVQKKIVCRTGPNPCCGKKFKYNYVIYYGNMLYNVFIKGVD